MKKGVATMGATLGEGKQVLELLLAKKASGKRMTYLLGGPLADLLDRDARPESMLPREMLRGLIGLPFQVVDENTIRVSKTEDGFEACWRDRKDARAKGGTEQEAVGNLICSFPWFFGLGVRWEDRDGLPHKERTRRTRAYLQEGDPTTRQEHVVITMKRSDALKRPLERFGPFSNSDEAEEHLRSKGWSFSKWNHQLQWNCRIGRYHSATAQIRSSHFADVRMLIEPEKVPRRWE